MTMTEGAAIVARPFVALALFLVAAIVSRVIYRAIPAGKLRTLLYTKHDFYSKTACISMWIASVVIFALIYWLAWDIL